MDVSLITASALDLPSSQRVDAIVYDGTTDLRPWPGPGPDRELVEQYGPELAVVLDLERGRLEDGALPIGGMLRLHRGKLHCDFLLWVATRPPEDRGIQQPAPDAALLKKAVKEALAFVRERHVARVAFGPLGDGPQALDEVERLVLIARAAAEYYDECFAAGRPAGVEHVLVCHRSASKISDARKKLGRAVKLVQEAPKVASADGPKRKKAATTKAAGTKRKASTRKVAPTISEDEIARGRATAGPYDRSRAYGVGELMVHPKFGVGRVDELTPEGFILVLFEGGDTRRLLHDRP